MNKLIELKKFKVTQNDSVLGFIYRSSLTDATFFNRWYETAKQCNTLHYVGGNGFYVNDVWTLVSPVDDEGFEIPEEVYELYKRSEYLVSSLDKMERSLLFTLFASKLSQEKAELMSVHNETLKKLLK